MKYCSHKDMAHLTFISKYCQYFNDNQKLAGNMKINTASTEI